MTASGLVSEKRREKTATSSNNSSNGLEQLTVSIVCSLAELTRHKTENALQWKNAQVFCPRRWRWSKRKKEKEREQKGAVFCFMGRLFADRSRVPFAARTILFAWQKRGKSHKLTMSLLKSHSQCVCKTNKIYTKKN